MPVIHIRLDEEALRTLALRADEAGAPVSSHARALILQSLTRPENREQVAEDVLHALAENKKLLLRLRRMVLFVTESGD